MLQTNRYYHDHVDRLDEGHSTVPEAEMSVCGCNSIEGTLFTGQTERLLGNNWPAKHTFLYRHDETRQIYPSFLTLHTQQEWTWQDENFDRLCKIRKLSEILNMAFSKSYNSSENLSVVEGIVGRKEESFSNNTYRRNTSVLASKFTNTVTVLDTRVTSKYTWGRTENAGHSIWQ